MIGVPNFQQSILDTNLLFLKSSLLKPVRFMEIKNHFTLWFSATPMILLIRRTLHKPTKKRQRHKLQLAATPNNSCAFVKK